MVTVTINEKRKDGLKALWNLEIDDENLDGPSLVAIFIRLAAINGFNVNLRTLKVKESKESSEDLLNQSIS